MTTIMEAIAQVNWDFLYHYFRIPLKAVFFFHYNLVFCKASITCTDHGTCGNDGYCNCFNDFYKDDCSSKMAIFITEGSKFVK